MARIDSIQIYVIKDISVMDFNLLFKSGSTYCGPAAAVWLVQAQELKH